MRPKRAYDLFVQKNYNPSISRTDEEQWMAERRRVDAAWHMLPPERRLYYKGLAKAQTDEHAELSKLPLKELVEEIRSRDVDASAPRGLKRKAAKLTFDQMSNHPIWQAGAQMMCMGSGLRQELVQDASQEQATIKCNKAFEYDSTPLPSHIGTLIPFSPCSIRCGGLCENDAHYHRAMTGTANIYTIMRVAAGKNLNLVLPLILHMRASESTRCVYFVCKSIGRGSLLLFVKGQLCEDSPAASQTFEVAMIDGCAVCITSYVAIKMIVESSGDISDKLDAITITAGRMALVPGSKRLEVAPAGDWWVEDKVVPLRSLLSRPRPTKSDVHLPFGLKPKPDAAPKPSRPPVDADASDDEEDGPIGGGCDAKEESDVLVARAEEELEREMPMEPADPPPPAPLPPPHADRPGPMIGIAAYDKAATGRATCLICDMLIPSGSWRFRYRCDFKFTPKSHRWVHAHCLSGLPISTRAHDLRQIREFQLRPGMPLDECNAVDNACDSWDPGHGGGAPSAFF